MTTNIIRAFALCLLASATALHAQVPQLINYQGRVAVGDVNFEGTGQFKFALVNADGTTTYWSNDGTSTEGTEPTNAVSLAVTKGLYSVSLGDTTRANMTAIPANVFANEDVRLRVWFDDGSNGSQLLTPVAEKIFLESPVSSRTTKMQKRGLFVTSIKNVSARLR